MSLVLAGCTTVGGAVPGAPPHHAMRGFRNVPEASGATPPEFAWDRIRLVFETGQPSRATTLGPEEALRAWQQTAPGDALLWLGHASVEIRLAGIVAAIDPVFASSLSPLGFGGPDRLSEPVFSAGDMPVADVIVVTHDHYDHFEPAGIARLAGRSPTACVLPLLVASTALGCNTLHQLDWGESAHIGALTVTFLPAQHESGRGAFDRDRTLWGAYLLEGGGKRIYVTGDTGYGPHFAEAAARYGAIDLVILSLGGYTPRSINRNVHMNPQEAIKALADLQARHAVLVHWGTYPLGLEDAQSAVEAIESAAGEGGFPRARLSILPIGGSLTF